MMMINNNETKHRTDDDDANGRRCLSLTETRVFAHGGGVARQDRTCDGCTEYFGKGQEPTLGGMAAAAGQTRK